MKKVIYFVVLCCCFSWKLTAQERGDTIPVMPEHYLARVAQFKKELVVRQKIVFLGNGFIESGKWKRLLNDSSVVNRGITGDIASSLLLRIGDVVNRKPSRVFLMLGSDDLFKHLTDESIIETLFSVATRIKKGSPETILFVLSILPVNPAAKNFPAGYNNEEHSGVINAQLQKYATRLGYTYIDLFSEFIDGKGHLETAYSSDGLNLNAAGYAHWIEILKKKNCF